MTYRAGSIVVLCAGLLLLPLPAAAASIANCNTDFTICGIPENLLLQLPFGAIAGDVVLTDPDSTAGDVFRIFNNLVNTGNGTGVGNMAFLYSRDDTTLPPSSTYSANVVFLPENPSGITSYVGNGTNYLLGIPEPRTCQLIGLAGMVLLAMARRAQRRAREDSNGIATV